MKVPFRCNPTFVLIRHCSFSYISEFNKNSIGRQKKNDKDKCQFNCKSIRKLIIEFADY